MPLSRLATWGVDLHRSTDCRARGVGPSAAELVRYAARRDWDKIAKLLKPVCTAPAEEAALDPFAEFADAWGRKYPAIVKLWERLGGVHSVPCGSTEIRSIWRSCRLVTPVGSGRRCVSTGGDVERPSAGLAGRRCNQREHGEART
jgi:hypothetical protein